MTSSLDRNRRRSLVGRIDLTDYTKSAMTKMIAEFRNYVLGGKQMDEKDP